MQEQFRYGVNEPMRQNPN